MSRMFTPRATAARQGVLATFLSVGLLAAGATGANAGFVLTLDDLSTNGVDVIVVDNSFSGTGTTAGASTHTDNIWIPGLVNYAGSVGSFTVNVTTGASKPIIGNPNVAVIDLNSLDISGGAGTLEVMLTDTNFSLPGANWPLTALTYHIGGTTNGTVTSEAWIDLNNVEFGGGQNTVGLCPAAAGPGAFSATCGLQLSNVPATPFSLTQRVKFTHTGAGQTTSFDGEVSFRVPEPATLALIGSGLLGLGLLRRRRAA